MQGYSPQRTSYGVCVRPKDHACPAPTCWQNFRHQSARQRYDRCLRRSRHRSFGEVLFSCGKLMMNSDPLPALLDTVIAPLRSCSAIFFTMESPDPHAGAAALARKERFEDPFLHFLRNTAALSRTDSVMRPPESVSDTCTGRLDAEPCSGAAFVMRFITTLWN